MGELHSRHGGDLRKSLLKGVKCRWSSEISSLLCQFVASEMGRNGRENGEYLLCLLATW